MFSTDSRTAVSANIFIPFTVVDMGEGEHGSCRHVVGFEYEYGLKVPNCRLVFAFVIVHDSFQHLPSGGGHSLC